LLRALQFEAEPDLHPIQDRTLIGLPMARPSTVRAPLIDCDFSKTVRILVPKGAPWRKITEGVCALQHLTRGEKPYAFRQDGRVESHHGFRKRAFMVL
jgi:hypothetical protein